jgi:hypothetical protein
VNRLAVILAASLAFAGCGGKQPAPIVALALDGPPLALVGEYAGMYLEGSLDRGVMAGKGRLFLGAVDEAGQSFECEASFNSMPTEKGRVRGFLLCGRGRKLPASLRNVGPDQGVGIARERDKGDLMIFFYHASLDEARRRFPSVKADIEQARAMQQQFSF